MIQDFIVKIICDFSSEHLKLNNRVLINQRHKKDRGDIQTTTLLIVLHYAQENYVP